jgi:hypothetical protein
MVCTLRWVLLFCLSLVGLAVSAVLGWMDELYRLDPTFISFAIIGLYSIVTLFVGWLTWAAPTSLVTRYRPACGYVPELMVGLGMLGTVIGFLMMLSAFGTLDATNVQVTQTAIARIGSGVGVALLTTLVGLACSMALHLQLVNLDLSVQS